MYKFFTDEEMPQGSQEWLDWRKGKITATQAGAVMGEPFPFKDSPKTWRDLRELAISNKEIKVNKYMKKGKDLEPLALARFNEVKEIEAAPYCVERTFGKSEIQLGASIDGFKFPDPEGPQAWEEDFNLIDEGLENLPVWVEIKCPWNGSQSDLWANVEEGKIPPYYEWQMVHQFISIGKKNAKGFFFVYDKSGDFVSHTLSTNRLLRKSNELAKQIRVYASGTNQAGDLVDDEEFKKLEEMFSYGKHMTTIGKRYEDEAKAGMREYRDGIKKLEGSLTKQVLARSTGMDWERFKREHPQYNYKSYKTTSWNWRINMKKIEEKAAE